MTNTNEAVENDEKKLPVDEVDQFEFPWTLIETIKQIKNYFQGKSKSQLKQAALHSYHLQLLVFFCLSIADVILGSIYRVVFYDSDLVVITSLTQGSIGILTVLIHICVNTCDWTPSKIMHQSKISQKYIHSIIIVGQLLIVLSIASFFASQVCFIIYATMVSHYDFHYTDIVVSGAIMCTIHIIMSIWIIYIHVWNNPRYLRRLKKYIEYCLEKQAEEKNKCLDKV